MYRLYKFNKVRSVLYIYSSTYNIVIYILPNSMANRFLQRLKKSRYLNKQSFSSGGGRLLSLSSKLRRRRHRHRMVRYRTKPEMCPPADALVRVSPEHPRTVESRRIEPISSLPLLQGSRHGRLGRPPPRLSSPSDVEPPGDVQRRCGGPRR